MPLSNMKATTLIICPLLNMSPFIYNYLYNFLPIYDYLLNYISIHSHLSHQSDGSFSITLTSLCTVYLPLSPIFHLEFSFNHDHRSVCHSLNNSPLFIYLFQHRPISHFFLTCLSSLCYLPFTLFSPVSPCSKSLLIWVCLTMPRTEEGHPR